VLPRFHDPNRRAACLSWWTTPPARYPLLLSSEVRRLAPKLAFLTHKVNLLPPATLLPAAGRPISRLAANQAGKSSHRTTVQKIFNSREPVCRDSSLYRVKARCGLQQARPACSQAQAAQTHSAKDFEEKGKFDDHEQETLCSLLEPVARHFGGLSVRDTSFCPIAFQGHVHADERNALGQRRASSRRILARAFNGNVLQVMPWPTLQNMTDQDLRAI